MSAIQQPEQPKYSQVREVMRQMGCKKGTFTPIPPAQHKWQLSDDDPLHRMWAWMIAKTCALGFLSPWAVDAEGHELHLERMAKDLGMDEANCRAYWRKGCDMGLWRNGDKTEGKRRLLLCGEVRPARQTEGPEPDQQKGMRIPLPPYILKQIKDWPSDRVEQFMREEQADRDFDLLLRADLDAMRRAIIAQQQDTRYRAYGIKKIREQHEPHNGQAAAHAARQNRVQELLPLFKPVLERYAHTFPESAQTSENGLRTPSTATAHTRATLLSSDLVRSPEIVGASGNLDAVPRPSEAHHSIRARESKYLPADELPDLASEDLQAYDLLFSEIERMQTKWRHTSFASEKISRTSRSDQILVRRILNAVTAPNVASFLIHVIGKFKGLDLNAMAKLPPRAPDTPRGPRSLGLILDWAIAWGEAHGIPQYGRGAGAGGGAS